MPIILKLKEEQIYNISKIMLTESVNQTVKTYLEKSENIMKRLEKHFQSYGKLMKNIENGKEYYVLDNPSLSDIIGYNMVVARLVKMDKQYGQFVIKPRTMFTF